MDFIERVPEDELNDKNVFKHYINHFPVFRKDATTSKCRRVFDASLHKKGKACLNDKMLKGSQLTPHILKVLIQIRLLKNLFTLDISKAFLRMVLKPSDRNFTCFFFRDDINPFGTRFCGSKIQVHSAIPVLPVFSPKHPFLTQKIYIPVGLLKGTKYFLLSLWHY